MKRCFLIWALVVSVAAAAGAVAAAATTERVSVSSTGAEGDGESRATTLSADGRFAVFYSHASNLVPSDTNGTWDVFVRDRLTGVTERVSVDSSGVEANDFSVAGAVSADGRFVAFGSAATNLVPGDTNGFCDSFVHDRLTGTTERVSMGGSGAQSDLPSQPAAISADGRYILFVSCATNLVPGDTNGTQDVFVRDRLTGVTERVSVDSSGAEANAPSYPYPGLGHLMSSDGRYVVFCSHASNLVPGDTNGALDVFVRDRLV